MRILFFISIFFALSCQKQTVEQSQPLVENQSNLNASERSSVGAVTMTVAPLSSLGIVGGKTLIFQVKLLNGTAPIANAIVNIDDPIGNVCVSVKTDAKGLATYNRTTNSSTVPSFYYFTFYYNGLKINMLTSVLYSNNVINLSSLEQKLGIKNSLDDLTAATTQRYLTQITSSDEKKLLYGAQILGKAVVKDYLSNPANKVVVGATIVSCGTAIVMPVAAPTCIMGIKTVASGLGDSSFKVITQHSIDAQTHWSQSTKNKVKSVLNATSTVYAISKLKPGKGFDKLENAATLWEFTDNALGSLQYDNKGTLRGISIPVQIKGTKEICLVCAYKR